MRIYFKFAIPCLIIIVFFISLSFSFEDELDTVPIHELKTHLTYPLNVEEPSGLSLSSESGVFFTVSDNTNRIYKISETGEILDEFSYNGNDLEGVVYNPADNTIWVAEERNKEIVNIDMFGNEINRISIPLISSKKSNGTEGICINPSNGHIFALNEKEPGKLIEINSSGFVINETELSFANDYSGICFGDSNGELWILSDESSIIARCDLSGTVINKYSIDVKKAEGIAIDFEKGFIYIVCDSKEKLHIFLKP
jgi:uncharacterized protein YjiK